MAVFASASLASIRGGGASAFACCFSAAESGLARNSDQVALSPLSLNTATMPTDFGSNFTDVDLLTEALEKWAGSGIPMTAMETSDVGQHLAELMGVVMAHPEIDLPDLYLDARLA